MTALIDEPLSRVRPEALRWLWEPYLASGKLAVLDGDPGVGKSLVTLDLAARLSAGRPLPDGKPGGPPLVTLLLNAEDDGGDTTRPRAEAAGADLDRVVCVTAPAGPPRFPADLPGLEGSIRRHAAGLVVVDPMMAFFPPDVAANSDQCIRSALTPLAGVAARTGAAVVLVRHLTKTGRPKAVHRGAGSVGIIGAARTGLLVAAHPTDPAGRVLAVAKTNLDRGPTPLGFRVAVGPGGHPVVEWTGPADVTADALGELPAVVRARDRATDWLRRELAGGPRPSADVYAAAAAAGVPERTLERAKAGLRAGSHRAGGKWYWYDPSLPWPADAPFPEPFGLRGLDDL
jgi:hypothetical protein